MSPYVGPAEVSGGQAFWIAGSPVSDGSIRSTWPASGGDPEVGDVEHPVRAERYPAGEDQTVVERHLPGAVGTDPHQRAGGVIGEQSVVGVLQHERVGAADTMSEMLVNPAAKTLGVGVAIEVSTK